MRGMDALDLRRQDAMADYRPQREWIEGRGLLLPIAHFFSGVGAGTWLLSWWLGFEPGQWAALLLVGVFSGIAHLGFLGRWERFWRLVRRPDRSWISRGLLSIGLFLCAGGASLLPGVRDTAAAPRLAVLALVGALLTLVYEGFVYRAARAIPFWRSPWLPLLYIVYGLRGGAALLLVAAAFGAAFDLDAVEAIKLWVGASTAVLVLVYLAGAGRAGGAARRSVRELVAGRISVPFYAGVIVIGIVVPLALGLWLEPGPASLGLVAAIGVASLIGDLYVKYCVVKAGIYAPLHGAGLSQAGGGSEP